MESIQNHSDRLQTLEADTLLTRQEVAELLCVSISTIKRYELREENPLIPTKLSARVVRYNPKEVKRFIQGSEINFDYWL